MTRASEQTIAQLVSRACRVYRAAYDDGNIEAVKDMNLFLLTVLKIQELIDIFELTHKITGPNGAAQRLGITRNGVYCRLEQVGLEHSDLIEHNACLESLVKKSRITGPLIESYIQCR